MASVNGLTQMFNTLSLGGQRRHVVIFSGECLFLSDLHVQLQQTLIAELRELASKSNQFELHFTSYGSPQQEYSAAATLGIPVVSCIQRRGPQCQPPCLPQCPCLRGFIRSCWDAGKVVIVCGTVKEDMYIAAHTKSFLIAASWVPDLSAKVQEYGILAHTPTKMRALIEIVANQTGWFYSCTFNSFPVPIPGLAPAGTVLVPVLVPVPAGIVPVPVHVQDPVPTKVVSLCFANYYPGSGATDDEEFMARAFEAILKNGDNNPAIKEALFCHLMAAIAHDNDFREVQDWAVAPSSSHFPNVNQVMEELKERVRCMMYGRKPVPIFIRHVTTTKSRYEVNQQARQCDNNYCQKHFKSIHVNNEYRGKLKGRVVCVLDDYLTHGNTFEALRNLLVACEVKKIIFVSIGKFIRKNEMYYHQKDFCIQGDVHTLAYEQAPGSEGRYFPNYTATFSGNLNHRFQCNFNARRSLEDLRTLANYLQ